MAAAPVKRSNPAAALKSYGLPVMNIQLSGVTLDQINAGTKDIKYEGNSVSIAGSGVDFIADNVTIKGHGNSSWKDKKKPYQIKFDSKESLLLVTMNTPSWYSLFTSQHPIMPTACPVV